MKLLQKYRSSKIVRKIIKTILVLEIISLIITVFLSYFILWPRLKNSAISKASATNAEIANQINTAVTTMADLSGFIQNSSQLHQALDDYHHHPNDQYYNRVCLVINNLTSSISSIRGVILDEGNGTAYTSIINLSDRDFVLLETPWYKNLQRSAYSKGYSSIYSVRQQTEFYTMAYVSNHYIGTKNYTLSVFFNVNSMIQTVDTLSSNLFNGCVITDEQGNIFYENRDSGHIDQLLSDDSTYRELFLPQQNYIHDEAGYYFNCVIPKSFWHSITFIDHLSLTATFWEHFFITLLLCSILCLITILFMVPLIYKIISPIHTLSTTMNRVSDGHLDVRSNVCTNDEIGELSIIYNHMLDSLNRQIQSIVEYESNEHKMKYNLLIAQIDSHFIYNTMSIINSLARRKKYEDIISINSALIKILQNCLRVKDIDVTDTVAQEMNIVNQYWIIENKRYDNHANLIWQVPDSMLNHPIPKNLIQPLVENCLFHGLIDEETGEIFGTITVSINNASNQIIIRVRDNGKGIPEEKLDLLNNPGELTRQLNDRGRHIGLSNIRQRLSYIYNGHANMIINNDSGTVVTLYLPEYPTKFS